MYTIYIKQSSIRIIPLGEDSEVSTLEGNKNPVLEIHGDFQAEVFIGKIREMLHSENPVRWDIYHSNPKSVLKEITQNLKYIKAAGGLVRNEKKEYLFIFRLGYWDLPKGKLEPGEDIENCAMREVEEECGLRISVIKREIPSTYHIYEQDNTLIIKRTYWFLMRSKEGAALKPQTEEGITEACWVPKTELGKIRENTYPSVLEVMEAIPE